MLRHAVRPFWPDISVSYIPIGPVDLGNILINGWAGVDLFFVLSGFLIGSHLMRGIEAGGGLSRGLLADYARRRYFRIAPVYYLVLGLILLGAFPYYPYPENMNGIARHILDHVLFLQDYYPADINVVFWSLGVEAKFYLFAPFLIWGVLKLPRVGWRVGAITAMIGAQILARIFFAPEVSGYEAYFLNVRSLFHFSMDGLLMGVLVACVWRDEGVRKMMSGRVASILYWGGLILLVGLLFSRPLVDLGVGVFERVGVATVLSVGFGAVMLGALGQAKGSGVLGWSGFSFPAKISYSLYLVHLPLLFLSEVALRHFVNLDGFAPQVQLVMFLPIFFALSFMVSTVLYVFVEKPFIDWSHAAKN